MSCSLRKPHFNTHMLHGAGIFTTIYPSGPNVGIYTIQMEQMGYGGYNYDNYDNYDTYDNYDNYDSYDINHI